MPPLFPLTLALYAVSGTLYLAHLTAANRLLSRAARIVLGLAFLSQAGDIGWLCAHGLHPVVNAREAIFFLSWLMCGAYLLTSFRFEIPVLGALVVPVAMVLDVAGRLTPTKETQHAGTLLASVHITLASAGVALFTVAAGGAVLYLLSERNLKQKKSGVFGRGPALETLDRMNRACIVLGFPLFTVAMVTGAVWMMRLTGSHGLYTPQYLLATVTWLLYGGLLVARVTGGWRGRKAALITLAGFGTAMAVLLIYLLRGVTGAQIFDMTMRLCVVGLSHRTAPVEVRERVAFAEEALGGALKQAVTLPGIGEAMIVSTCNRVELYAGVDADDSPEQLARLLIEGRSLSESLRTHLYSHDGEAALTHLFRVAASLDSMVLGEPQILGQVKEAFALATTHGTVGPLLQKALPRAFAVAKRVRSETDIARNSASIASAAVELARQIFGNLNGRQVLVVGAGKMGALSAKHLQSSGIGELVVVNRTQARAEALAEGLGGRAAPWEELDALLGKADIVLCSTGAAEPVIAHKRVERVMKTRRGRWLFFIDIAVPRDVEPSVGEIGNVYLYDVDALEEVVARNRAGRASEASEAEDMVREEVRRFAALERAAGVIPVIKALRARFHEVALAEVTRLHGLAEADRARMVQLAEGIANKLLHPALTALKKDGDGERLAEALVELFGLSIEEARLVVVGEKK